MPFSSLLACLHTLIFALGGKISCIVLVKVLESFQGVFSTPYPLKPSYLDIFGLLFLKLYFGYWCRNNWYINYISINNLGKCRLKASKMQKLRNVEVKKL